VVPKVELCRKGLSIKDVCSQKGRAVRTIKGEILQMWTSALFVQKYLVFEIYDVSALTRGGGIEPMGEGVIFCDFVRTSFMDGLQFKITLRLRNSVNYIT